MDRKGWGIRWAVAKRGRERKSLKTFFPFGNDYSIPIFSEILKGEGIIFEAKGVEN